VANICRGVAVTVAEGKAKGKRVIGKDVIKEFLGAPKFLPEVAERTGESGVATGLAWTPVGGDIIFVEASQMPGKGNLVMTGQLGDVMKESAQAALSFIRSRAETLGIDPKFLEGKDIHLHIPAGAIPKDGPSAGITMFTAILSMLLGRKVRHDVAMTGEITLRGSVLPVGGIKEKALAAHRAGITRIVMPERNRKDLEDIPEEARDELEILFVSRMEDALALVLEEVAEPESASA
jgi:ATP-dependent Lon protease